MIDHPWPEPVERVAAFLRASSAEARLEQFASRTARARDAAAAIGCGLDQIVKSVVMICDRVPVIALVPGDRRADPAKVARAVGAAQARIAGPEEVVEATAFDPGAVAPFPLQPGVNVVVERMLLAHPLVWVGAGSPRHMVGLAPAELLRLTRADAEDLVAGD